MKTVSVGEQLSNYRLLLNEATEEPVNEKWDTDYETPESKKGMFKGRTQASLKAQLERLKNKKTKSEADKTKEHELVFALRAKHKFGSIEESDAAYFAQALKEGVRIGFEELLKKYHTDVDGFLEHGEIYNPLYDALYDYYFDEMPYGVAKARTGDPYEWIQDRFTRDLEHEGISTPQEVAPATNVTDVTMPMGETKSVPGPFSKKAQVSEDSWTQKKCKGCDKVMSARESGQPEPKGNPYCKSCKEKRKKK